LLSRFVHHGYDIPRFLELLSSTREDISGGADRQRGAIDVTANTSVSLSGGKGGSVSLEAASATVSGPQCTVSAQATAQVQGALVKIN
jgi:hypothetical protein